MGIKGLMTLIKSDAPNSFSTIKKTSSKDLNKQHYAGKIIAIDASISLYQFLVQIRISGTDSESVSLTDADGNITSHIQGFLMRTTNLLEQGIIPVYVFDGKPPDLKQGTLSVRKELKNKAELDIQAAKDRILEHEDETEHEKYDEYEEDKKTIKDYSKRVIHVSKEQNNDVRILLKLMGIECIDAPQEAEAQCASLVSSGHCYATGSEDTDSLTFGSTRIIRNLTSGLKEPMIQINLPSVIKEFGLSGHDSFIDLCILCGCDYCPNIKGVGPKTALNLIVKYDTIENVLKNLPERLYSNVPDNYIDIVNQSRMLFKNHVVISPDPGYIFKIHDLDESGLYNYLSEKSFNKERILKVIDRLKNVRPKPINPDQKSLKSFFKKS